MVEKKTKLKWIPSMNPRFFLQSQEKSVFDTVHFSEHEDSGRELGWGNDDLKFVPRIYLVIVSRISGVLKFQHSKMIWYMTPRRGKANFYPSVNCTYSISNLPQSSGELFNIRFFFALWKWAEPVTLLRETFQIVNLYMSIFVHSLVLSIVNMNRVFVVFLKLVVSSLCNWNIIK